MPWTLTWDPMRPFAPTVSPGNPRALCYSSHVRCGGEHPPNFVVLGQASQASPAPVWDGHRGAKASPVGRGTTPPSHVPSPFLRPLGTSNVNAKPQTGAYARQCRPAHFLGLDGIPMACPAGFSFQESGPHVLRQGNSCHAVPLHSAVQVCRGSGSRATAPLQGPAWGLMEPFLGAWGLPGVTIRPLLAPECFGQKLCAPTD